MSLKAEVMSLRRKHGTDRAICLFDLISVASTWVMCGYFDVLLLVWKEADIHESFSIMARGIQFTPLSGIKLILLLCGNASSSIFQKKKYRNVCNCLRDKEIVSFSIFCFIL